MYRTLDYPTTYLGHTDTHMYPIAAWTNSLVLTVTLWALIIGVWSARSAGKFYRYLKELGKMGKLGKLTCWGWYWMANLQNISSCSSPTILGLGTGTRFIVVPVNRHRYHNRYGHSYSFDIHFDMFLTRYTRKMQEIYVFYGELCWKRLCWHVNCALPLFCTGARLSQCARIQEISCWEEVEEAILVGISRIKCFFYCN